jgi:putative oxidoreductase
MNSDPSARYAPLVLRLVLGSLFIVHLYWKFEILPGGLPRWWNYLASEHAWFVPWYVLSAELAGAMLIIPGIYACWASLYALPMMLGAAQFWAARKGFYFTTAGAELPLVWSVLLVLQVMLGDGPYRLRASWGTGTLRQVEPHARRVSRVGQ